VSKTGTLQARRSPAYLVEHQDLGVATEGACDADELALTYAKVLAILKYSRVERPSERAHSILQVDLVQGRPHLLVCFLVKGIEVGADGA